MSKKHIEVVPYNPRWLSIFEEEAKIIADAMVGNLLAIHHIGSTSVPGLSAKPTIDIIASVRSGPQAIKDLTHVGYTYKGEWNIPFKFGFTKRGEKKINLHVFEGNHPEIDYNLTFRDHLRTNPQSRVAYEQLKMTLLGQESSFQKEEGALFAGYNLGKNDFICKILIASGYARHRFLRVTHHAEWAAYHRIRAEQIFTPEGILYDSNHPTITASGHHHFILCEGCKVVSVAHVEFLNEKTAALRSLATDSSFQHNGFGKELLALVEKWLKTKSISTIKVHRAPHAVSFYKKCGYKEAVFEDLSIFTDCVDLKKEI